MSLRKENTQPCHNDRLAAPDTEQEASSLTVVELSDRDLERVMGGDGPSGIRAFRNGNAPGFPGRPGRPGFPVGPGFPWDPGFSNGRRGCDGFGPDFGDELVARALWGWL